MNDEQIKIFLAVAKAGSFSKAEENMHISKQAMLKQINALESELGARLLARSRLGISLTPSGQVFQKGIVKTRVCHLKRSKRSPERLRFLLNAGFFVQICVKRQKKQEVPQSR